MVYRETIAATRVHSDRTPRYDKFCPRCGRETKPSGNQMAADGLTLCRDCRDVVAKDDRVWYAVYTGAMTFEEATAERESDEQGSDADRARA